MGPGTEGFREPFLVDYIRRRCVLLVPPVNRHDSCLVERVKSGTDVDCCGREKGGLEGDLLVERGLDRVVGDDSGGVVGVRFEDAEAGRRLEGETQVLEQA